MTRRILFGLLGLGPAVVVLDLLGAPDMLLFLLALLAAAGAGAVLGDALGGAEVDRLRPPARLKLAIH